MKAELYNLSSDSNKLVYSFLSVGPKGVITKVIVYEALQPNLYNLAFGDYDVVTNTINDSSNSNNQDVKKVIATVVKSIRQFFEKYPDCKLIISGSTETRTRLYQRIIKENLAEFETEFIIEGKLEQVNQFEKLDFVKNYAQFRISKKAQL